MAGLGAVTPAAGVPRIRTLLHAAPLLAPRHVRRAAVQVLSTGAHNKPGLVVDHLPSALPLLYQQTIVSGWLCGAL